MIASMVALGVAAVVLWLVVRYASDRPDQVRLGDQIFDAGRADRLAEPIARDGPALFKDPLNRSREIFLQHVGDDPGQGWVAVDAYAPGAPRELRCLLAWEQPSRQFRDPCGGATFPPDGAGLRTYPAVVDGRRVVVVDLRTGGQRVATTTSAAISTPTSYEGGTGGS